MKKVIYINYLLLNTLIMLAFNGHINASVEGDINFKTAYRIDNFRWNIPGNISGNNVNILSELTWSNIEILQFTIGGKLLISDAIYIRGSIGYGIILNGKNQDSDYFGNNRTLEFSRSNNQANKGDVWDITLGIGYKITAISKKLFIYPIGGFSYNAQNLRMTDGFQTLDPYGQIGFTGPFSGLNSTYDAKWFGLWTGFDLNWKIIKELSLTLGFEVHFTSYTAEADWNLRQDFLHPKSFKHEAFGMGINLSVCIAYDLTDNWVINTEFTYLNWWTNRGIDRTYMANGTIIEGNINEVLWKSFSISLGVNYKF